MDGGCKDDGGSSVVVVVMVVVVGRKRGKERGSCNRLSLGAEREGEERIEANTILNLGRMKERRAGGTEERGGRTKRGERQ